MARGIVYILTNKKFQDNIIKIGKTQQSDVEIRIQELNRATGVPFPFECYSAFEIDNYDEIEKILHEAYRSADKQTYPKKEFFEINPEKARGVLAKLAAIHNGNEVMLDNAKIYSEEEERIVESNQESIQDSRNYNFKFSNYGIPTGSQLVFTRNPNINCEVLENNKVKYEEEEFSLSALTKKIFVEVLKHKSNSGYNGYRFWSYNDEILSDIRDSIDNHSSIVE